MTTVILFAIATSFYGYDDVPHIAFLMHTGPTHRKMAYQDDFSYEVELDQFGRPCPTGRFAKRRVDGLGGGLERNLDLMPISVLPPTPGYYLFCSGRLVYLTLISGEGKSRIYAPDFNKRIISIDAFLQGNEVDPSRVNDYRQVFGIKATRMPQHRDLFLLPGSLTAYQGTNKYSANSLAIADYPQKPPAFVETKPAQTQEQQFKTDYSQRFAIRFKQLIYTVTIDKTTAEYRFEDFAKMINAEDKTRPPLPPWLMKPKKPDESVYELRCGRLIPGFLHELGKEEWLFIPDIGGTIMDAGEYLKTYQPWCRRIYNLPGRFVPQPEK